MDGGGRGAGRDTIRAEVRWPHDAGGIVREGNYPNAMLTSCYSNALNMYMFVENQVSKLFVFASGFADKTMYTTIKITSF